MAHPSTAESEFWLCCKQG